MKKVIFFFSFFLCYLSIKAQDTTKLNHPNNIFSVDILGAVFSEATLYYEHFNGKNRGNEFGIGVMYPNSSLQYDLNIGSTSFCYNGLLARYTRKLYFFNKKKRYIQYYWGPSLVLKYKYFREKEMLLSGNVGSDYAIYTTASQDKYVASIMGNFGIVNKKKLPFENELFIGIGVSAISTSTNYLYYRLGSEYSTTTNPNAPWAHGHLFKDNQTYIFPVVQIGFKLGLGFKSK